MTGNQDKANLSKKSLDNIRDIVGVNNKWVIMATVIAAIISAAAALFGSLRSAKISSNGANNRLATVISATKTKEAISMSKTKTEEYVETQSASIFSPGGKTPIPTPTPLPSITPIPTTAVPTQDMLISKTPEKQAPDQFVKEYYDLLNKEDYRDAWEMLDQDFRDNMNSSIHSYINYWEITIPVSITELYVERKTDLGANVIVTLYFEKKSFSQSHRFRLIFNKKDYRWSIIGVEDFYN